MKKILNLSQGIENISTKITTLFHKRLLFCLTQSTTVQSHCADLQRKFRQRGPVRNLRTYLINNFFLLGINNEFTDSPRGAPISYIPFNS